MKLALLGHPIAHSLSPKIYRELLGNHLESYELLDFADSGEIPSLEELAQRYDGLSITAPYKTHFLNDVVIESKLTQKIGAINTIAFRKSGIFATNTDCLATTLILERFKVSYPRLQLILLGSGSMAKMTILIADSLGLPLIQKSRVIDGDISRLDLRDYATDDQQTIIINSCSRSFVFNGFLDPRFIFWDYNYLFEAHEKRISPLVKAYYDGQEMLRLQAEEALRFWRAN